MRRVEALLECADDVGARRVRQTSELLQVVGGLVQRLGFQWRGDEQNSLARMLRFEYVQSPAL